MKTKLLTLLICIGMYVSAQSIDVQVNTLPMLVKNVSGSLFFNTSDKHSFGITAGYQFPSEYIYIHLSPIRAYQGYIIVPEYRMRMNEGRHFEFFFGAFLKYRNNYRMQSDSIFGAGLNAKNTYEEVYKMNNNAVIIGANLGFNFFFDSGFIMTPMVGLGVTLYNKSALQNVNPNWVDPFPYDDDIDDLYDPIVIRLGFSIGYRFD